MQNLFLSDPYVQSLIHQKAIVLSNRISSAQCDVSDHKQFLISELLIAIRKFDEERGTVQSFATKVINNTVIRFLRDQRAQKRKGHVNPIIDDGIPDHRAEREQSRSEARMIVNEFMSRLSPEQRILAEKLKTMTPAEICRADGIAHSSLQRKFEQLRRQISDGNPDGFR